MTGFRFGASALHDAALIVIIVAIALIPSILARDLWNPDEPRYMEVAREMVVLDDYLVPHLNGEVYPDKPPMFFWLAAGLYHLGFGFNSGRIIAQLASLGTVLVVWRIARGVLPSWWALGAAVITFSAQLFFITSSKGVIDPLLTFFAVSSIACGLRAFRRNADIWWLGAYVLVALAILTKGPVGIMIPVVALASYGILYRKEVRGGGWIHLVGALAALAVVSAWAVPAMIAGGTEYRNEILFTQTSGRLVNTDSHQNPFYYYTMLLPVILLPWALFFFPAFWLAVRQWRSERAPAAMLALSWFVPLFVIFSAISGKRAGYILPLIPATGLLLANYFHACEDNPPWPRLHRALGGITLALYPLSAVAALAGYFATPKVAKLLHPGRPNLVAQIVELRSGTLPWACAALAITLTLFWISWWRGIRRNRPRFFAAMVVALTLLLSLFANVTLVSRTNTIKSGRTFAATARFHLEKADLRYLYRGDYSGAYNLYTGFVTLPILKKGMLLPALEGQNKVAVIAQENDIWIELGKPLRMGHVVLRKRVGHRSMVVLTNWREESE